MVLANIHATTSLSNRAAYRVVARIVGGWLGALAGGVPKREQLYYGIALLPQAGVAVGMALVAASALPDLADQIIALTIGTTIAFELIGPVLTLWAIRRIACTAPPPLR